MTARITANTLAAPLGFLVAGQVLEHWVVVLLFAAVVLGITPGRGRRRAARSARVDGDHVRRDHVASR